jgi:hypothetical protein
MQIRGAVNHTADVRSTVYVVGRVLNTSNIHTPVTMNYEFSGQERYFLRRRPTNCYVVSTHNAMEDKDGELN